MVWAALALPIALRDAETRAEAFTWAATYVLLVCMLPVMFIAYMVRCGRITDIHMQVRQQRYIPLVVSITCTVIAWFTLRLMGAPSIVQQFGLFSLVQIAIMTSITLIWQISIHAISMSSATVALWVVFGVFPAVLSFPLIILVGAARLKLKRHTPAQVVVGTLIGALIPVVLLMVIAV